MATPVNQLGMDQPCESDNGLADILERCSHVLHIFTLPLSQAYSKPNFFDQTEPIAHRPMKNQRLELNVQLCRMLW